MTNNISIAGCHLQSFVVYIMYTFLECSMRFYGNNIGSEFHRLGPIYPRAIYITI